MHVYDDLEVEKCIKTVGEIQKFQCEKLENLTIYW